MSPPFVVEDEDDDADFEIEHLSSNSSSLSDEDEDDSSSQESLEPDPDASLSPAPGLHVDKAQLILFLCTMPNFHDVSNETLSPHTRAGHPSSCLQRVHPPCRPYSMPCASSSLPQDCEHTLALPPAGPHSVIQHAQVHGEGKVAASPGIEMSFGLAGIEREAGDGAAPGGGSGGGVAPGEDLALDSSFLPFEEEILPDSSSEGGSCCESEDGEERADSRIDMQEGEVSSPGQVRTVTPVHTYFSQKATWTHYSVILLILILAWIAMILERLHYKNQGSVVTPLQIAPGPHNAMHHYTGCGDLHHWMPFPTGLDGTAGTSQSLGDACRTLGNQFYPASAMAGPFLPSNCPASASSGRHFPSEATQAALAGSVLQWGNGYAPMTVAAAAAGGDEAGGAVTMEWPGTSHEGRGLRWQTSGPVRGGGVPSSPRPAPQDDRICRFGYDWAIGSLFCIQLREGSLGHDPPFHVGEPVT